MFLIDSPPDYTQVEVIDEITVAKNKIAFSSRNIAEYTQPDSSKLFILSNYTKHTNVKNIRPASAALKRAMYRKSSKSIGKVLSK
jgi:hypothetical protein